MRNIVVILILGFLLFGCAGEPKTYLKAYMPVGPALVEGGIEGNIDMAVFENLKSNLGERKEECDDKEFCFILVKADVNPFPSTKNDVWVEIEYPKETIRAMRLADETKYPYNSSGEGVDGDTIIRRYRYGTYGEMVSEGSYDFYIVSQANKFGSLDVSKTYKFVIRIFNDGGIISEGTIEQQIKK